MNEPIRGKVARLLSSREVALNIGSEDGVAVDMYFDILDPTSQAIDDPDTGQILGSFHRPKTRVRVTWVDSRLSVATTYRKRSVNIGGHLAVPDFSGFSRALLPAQWVTKHETLKSRELGWEPLGEEDSFVDRGDPVVEVQHESEDPVYTAPHELQSGDDDKSDNTQRAEDDT